MMRMTRAAIINLLASPYIEMARLKGLSPARVIVRHALPNAWAPIVNVIALNLAYLIVVAWSWSRWCSPIRASAS